MYFTCRLADLLSLETGAPSILIALFPRLVDGLIYINLNSRPNVFA